MAGSADREARSAVVVVPRFEPRVKGYILHRWEHETLRNMNLFG